MAATPQSHMLLESTFLLSRVKPDISSHSLHLFPLISLQRKGKPAVLAARLSESASSSSQRSFLGLKSFNLLNRILEIPFPIPVHIKITLHPSLFNFIW